MATIIPDASIEGLQITNQAANGIRDSVQTIANMIHAKRLGDLATARQFMDMASKVDRPELQYDAFGMMGLDKDYAKSIIDNRQAQTINSMVPDENGNFALSGNGPEMQAEINRRFNGLISNAVKSGDYVSAQQYSDARDNEISLLAQRFDKQAPAGRGANYLSLARRSGAGGSKPIGYSIYNKITGQSEWYETNDRSILSSPQARIAFIKKQFGDRAGDYELGSLQPISDKEQSRENEYQREINEKSIAQADKTNAGMPEGSIIDTILDPFGFGKSLKEKREDYIRSQQLVDLAYDEDGNPIAVANPRKGFVGLDSSNVAYNNNSTGSGGFLDSYLDSKNVKAGPTAEQIKAQRVAAQKRQAEAANRQWEENRKKEQAKYDKANEAIQERQLKGEINYARDEKYKKEAAERKRQRKAEAVYSAVNKQVNQWIKDGYGANMTRKQLEAEAYRQLGLQRPNEAQTAPRPGEKVRINY